MKWPAITCKVRNCFLNTTQSFEFCNLSLMLLSNCLQVKRLDLSFFDSPRSAFRNLDCFRAFCDEECYWCLVVLEYRPFFLQQPKFLFMNLLPQQRNAKIVYIYLKKKKVSAVYRHRNFVIL